MQISDLSLNKYILPYFSQKKILCQLPLNIFAASNIKSFQTALSEKKKQLLCKTCYFSKLQVLSTKRFSLSFGTAYYKKFQTQKDFHESHARFASGNITSEYSNLIIPQFLLDIFGYMKDQNQV